MLTLEMVIQTEFDSKIQSTNNGLTDPELDKMNFKDRLLFLGLKQGD